ncbi:hypothetical protein NST74_24370 [Paenibacillus sp. FSL F4-0125]
MAERLLTDEERTRNPKVIAFSHKAISLTVNRITNSGKAKDGAYSRFRSI